jgi:hypothetical protein
MRQRSPKVVVAVLEDNMQQEDNDDINCVSCSCVYILEFFVVW